MKISFFYIYLILLFCFLYLSYLIYFLLFPLAEIFIIKSYSYTYTSYFLDNFVIKMDFLLFTNLIEINLPFFSSDILYLKLLLNLFIFMFIPFFYLIYACLFSTWFFVPETKENRFNLYLTIFFYISIFYFIYVFVFPFLLTWLFSHFTSFLFFEFNIRCDVEFLYGLWFKLVLISSIISVFSIQFVRFSCYLIIFILFFFLNISDFYILFFLFFFSYVVIRLYCSYFIFLIKFLLVYFQCSITQGKGKSDFSS